MNMGEVWPIKAQTAMGDTKLVVTCTECASSGRWCTTTNNR